MGVIYKITNPVNKIYIGQTTSYKNRLYRYQLLNCKAQIKLYNSLKKYGFENHNFEIIEECNDIELNIQERYWQDYYNVIDVNTGLNLKLTETHDLSGKQSIETIEKRRMKLLGQTRSNEFKIKCRERMLGNIQSDATKLKNSNAQKLKGNRPPLLCGSEHPNYGKSPTITTRKLMSKLRTGKPIHSDDYKKKLSESMMGTKNHFFGKTHSSQSKQQMSEAHTGIVVSRETRKKMSESAKGKHIGGKNNSAKRVIDTNTNKIYSCIKDAAIDNDIKISLLYSWLAKPNLNKTNLKYYND